MKNSFVVKFAAVALLAFGSLAQAQDDTPAPDAVADSPVAAAVVDAADAQESVSDTTLPAASVEGQVISPVEPIVDGAPLNQGIMIGTPSDCVGCGQVMPYATPVMNTSGCCGGCNTGCGSQMSYVQPASYMQPATYSYAQQPVSYVQPASYVAPMQSGCGTCASAGTVSTVAYQTPATQQSFGSVISAAPIVTSGVPASTVSTPSSIVTAAPAPVYSQPYTTGTTTGCAGCSGGVVSNPAPRSYGPGLLPTVGTTNYATPSYATSTPLVTSGCSTCGTTAVAAPVSTCNNCPQQGRRLLGGGRLLRNRR